MKLSSKNRKKFRIRNKLKYNNPNKRMRLTISRSAKNISAQIIDISTNQTLISATSNMKNIKNLKKKKSELSEIVATKLAEKAKEKKETSEPETRAESKTKKQTKRIPKTNPVVNSFISTEITIFRNMGKRPTAKIYYLKW